MGPQDVVLFTDWTMLRLFPPLRAAWAPMGAATPVVITGENAKAVLFGTIHPRTGHRVVLARPQARGEDARAFLRELRRHYRRARTIWLLADRASAHTDGRTQALAETLQIRFVWLPKQAPELNAMDQLWRELKRVIAANRQFPTIMGLATAAMLWVLMLSPREARVKADSALPGSGCGICDKTFVHLLRSTGRSGGLKPETGGWNGSNGE